MPQALAAAVTWVATAASAVAANAAAFITGGNIAIDTFVSTTVFYGTQLAIYAGLSVAMTPQVPKPEFGYQTLKQSVPPRRRGYGRYRTGGPFLCWEAREDQAFDIVALHAGEIDGIEAYFLNDDLVTVIGGVVQTGADGRYWGPDQRVKLDFRLGLMTETAYAAFITGLPGFWTSAHRGDGVATLAMICRNGKLVHFQHDFPNGEPSPSVVIRAQRIFDPRDVDQDEADPSTWVWSSNAALCYLHYLMYDRGYAYDWSSTEVPTFNLLKWNRHFGNTLATWVRAADICDEAVDKAAGGTEPRYEIGGQFQLDEDESAVVNQFLSSMDGWSSTDGQGGFVCYAGKFDEPAVTLTNAHIKGLTLDIGVPAENQVNQIDITFTDPAKNYNTNEADSWIDEAAVVLAGRPRAEALDLPWVQSFSQARRLAKRRMERHQASCRGSMTVNMAARAILGQRFLKVALTSGPTILRDLIIEVTGNASVDLINGAISFDWIAVDPEARDGWVPDDEEGTTPPPVDDTTGPPLAAPTIDTGWAWFVDSGAGLQPRLSLHVTGPDRADLGWEIRWRKYGLTLWQPTEPHDDIDSHPTLVLQSGYVPAATIVEAQVRYQTGGGIFSDWSLSKLVDTSLPVATADSVVILADADFVTADGAIG